MSKTEQQQQEALQEQLSMLPNFGSKLKILSHATVDVPAFAGVIKIMALSGSLLDYESQTGVIVNAANTGGITGFGIDELVNRAGGHDLKEFRRSFNGIKTGDAKSSPAFAHARKVKLGIVHAVGPVFRDNGMETSTSTGEKLTRDEKIKLLKAAYTNSLVEATKLGANDVAFCLLSAGVFRGREPLELILQLAIDGILAFYAQRHAVFKECDTAVPPVFVSLCAFTKEEQTALKKVVDTLAAAQFGAPAAVAK